MDRSLKEAFKDACQAQAKFEAGNYNGRITLQSSPTLFFGAQGNPALPIRILTAGYNPSADEFTRLDYLARVGPNLQISDLNGCTDAEAETALEMMRTYFERRNAVEGFTGFFGAFESMLHRLDSSFVQHKKSHLAAHVDACSPFASKYIVDLYYAPILSDGAARFWEVINHFPAVELLIGIGSKFTDVLKTKASIEGMNLEPGPLPKTYQCALPFKTRTLLCFSGDDWFNRRPFYNQSTEAIAQWIKSELTKKGALL